MPYDHHGLPTGLQRLPVQRPDGGCGRDRGRLLRSSPARRSGAQRGEEIGEPFLIGLATLPLIVTAGIEIFALCHLVSSARPGSSPPERASSAFTSCLRRVCARRASPAHRRAGPLMLLGLTVAGELAHPLKGGGAWAWPAAFGAHLLVPRGHAARPSRWSLSSMPRLLALALLGALLGRTITADLVARERLAVAGSLVVPAGRLLSLPAARSRKSCRCGAAPRLIPSVGAAVLAVALWLSDTGRRRRVRRHGRAASGTCRSQSARCRHRLALVAAMLWLRSVDQRRRRCLVPLGLPLVSGTDPGARLPSLRRRPYRLDAWLSSLAVQSGLARCGR